MPSPDRRAACRRRTWGRGPLTLKLESLERRALLTAQAGPLPDLVNSALTVSSSVSDWGNSFEAMGQVTNQGAAATRAPVEVTLYASPVRGVDNYAVAIGQATIPAGLAPGQSVPYQTPVTLPSSPIPHVSSNGGTVHVAAWVNQSQSVPEGNYRNNRDIGPPHDSAPVLIQPAQASNLVGTTLAVSAPATTWGSTVSVTAQVTNKGAGTSPQTIATLALTPQGLNYGNTTTVEVGTITIPPLGPYQTYNIVQNVTLPAVEPLAIANYSNFGLTMTEDANYATKHLYPHVPDQGVGYDQTPMTITTSSTSTATTGALPDLAASSVIGPTGTIRWGQSFPVTTQVQNLGQGGAGAFKVFYVLTGQAGSVGDSIYLGQSTVSGLAAGSSQQLTQSLTLPSRLPSGVTLGNVGYARVAVIVNPQNAVNETLKSNNESISAPFIVRLPGGATLVPTQAAAGSLPTVANVAQSARNAAKLRAAQNQAGSVHITRQSRKLYRHQPPPTNSLLNKGASLATEITRLPHQIQSVITKSL